MPAGRPPGSTNKLKAFRIVDKCEELGVDPLATMLDLLNDDDKEMRFKVAKELLKYLYPPRRAEDAQGNPDGEIIVVPKTDEERIRILKLAKGDQ